MGKELSIYIHIPFCVKKCLYCDFLSFYAENDMIRKYFDALKKEIELASEAYKDFEISTVFFGGGTPSFVDGSLIVDIMDFLRSHFIFKEDTEISIEANPASALAEKLRAFRKCGINRLSIGAQSLNDKELQMLGRAHSVDDFYRTYDNARNAGFGNINIDVMSALPEQTMDTYLSTLQKVIELKPEHISAYSLIVEENTPFFDMELKLPDEDTDRKMYHETKELLAGAGYSRYEISNYSLGKKYECRHNKVYWQRGNYLGLGLGAASMTENVRWSNIRNINEYLGFSKLEDIRENVDRLSLDAQMEEYMFLGLRLVEGVNTNLFEKLFEKSITGVYGETIDKYLNLGLLEYKGENNKNLSLTDKGLDVSNTVMADFLL